MIIIVSVRKLLLGEGNDRIGWLYFTRSVTSWWCHGQIAAATTPRSFKLNEAQWPDTRETEHVLRVVLTFFMYRNYVYSNLGWNYDSG